MINEKCEEHCFCTAEALYCHLTKIHKDYMEEKIGDAGRRTQKLKVMEELIVPELQDWLKQVMKEAGGGLWMLSQSKFGAAFHNNWRPHG